MASGKEIGAAVTVYRDGKKVVDLFGGYRNGITKKPWQEDTIVNVFSTTKGVAALSVALAASRGLISYDAKVADYRSVTKCERALTVVRPGEGRAGNLGPIGVVFKLWDEDTGGAVAIVEHPFPVGALVPPHLHTREDEYSIVTEGEIGFRSGDREAVLGAGGYITKPRGEHHTMWNAGSTPARMIEVISPAGFEKFFRDLADLTTDRTHPSRHSRHSQRPTDCSSANLHGYPTSSPATTSSRPAEREARPHKSKD